MNQDNTNDRIHGFRRHARERTTRRRRIMAVTAVGAAVVAMVVGVQQIARPQPDSVRTPESPQGEQGGDGPTADSTVPVTVPAGSAGSVPSRPASTGGPAFVWKVVEPDKDEAISSVFGPGTAPSFPALAVSTAPGRSDDLDNPDARIWRTDDGVSWELTDLRSPFGSSSFFDATSIGSELFAVGTAPGGAVDEVNPLQVAFTDADSADWTTVDLPLDDNEFRQIPFASVFTETHTTALDDGVLVAVTPLVDVDLPGLVRNATNGIDPNRIVSSDADGVVLLSQKCETDAVDDSAPSTTDGESCTTQHRLWSDLGIPARTATALADQATRFFRVGADGTVTVVDSPVPGASLTSRRLGATPVFFDQGQVSETGTDPITRHEYVDGQWVAVDGPRINWSSQPAVLGDRTVGFSRTATGTTEFASLLPDGSVERTDVGTLFEPDTTLEQPSLATTDDRAVAVVRAQPDPIAGAETTPEAAGGWRIATTADGVEFSVESVADLVGVDPETVDGAPRISTDGRQVVIVVTLNERYPDDSRKQIVLVGTPVG